MVVHSSDGNQIIGDWCDGKSLCRVPFHEKELVPVASTVSNRELARVILEIFREAPAEFKRLGLDSGSLGEAANAAGEALKEDARKVSENSRVDIDR
ncbi:MAG TPA: hypothetical protein VFA64_18065, partial [Hyphomicrobiaceae bacterium]|nr:hypothetical protein [Hyphomicrobiaceae bacterium]